MNQTLIQPLRATLRLQFHKGFTLEQAVPLVPYFAQLGISHIYASPLLAARAGSMHGYDVVDPRKSTRNSVANRHCGVWSAPCANTAWG